MIMMVYSQKPLPPNISAGSVAARAFVISGLVLNTTMSLTARMPNGFTISFSLLHHRTHKNKQQTGWPSKSQLISNGLFVILNSSKKRTYRASDARLSSICSTSTISVGSVIHRFWSYGYYFFIRIRRTPCGYHRSSWIISSVRTRIKEYIN